MLYNRRICPVLGIGMFQLCNSVATGKWEKSVRDSKEERKAMRKTTLGSIKSMTDSRKIKMGSNR